MAYDTQSTGNVSTAFPVKMPEEQGSLHQPFKGRMPLHWRWQFRMGSYHIPFPNQEIKLFQRAGWLWWEFRMLIHHSYCLMYFLVLNSVKPYHCYVDERFTRLVHSLVILAQPLLRHG